jgi:hypothetical protein
LVMVACWYGSAAGAAGASSMVMLMVLVLVSLGTWAGVGHDSGMVVLAYATAVSHASRSCALGVWRKGLCY